MMKNYMVRLLALEEEITDLANQNTGDNLVLKEYVRYNEIHENGTKETRTVPTGCAYELQEFAKNLRESANDLVTVYFYERENINTDCYQFAFQKNKGIITESLGNLNHLAIVIPQDIKEKYRNDTKMIAFQEMLKVTMENQKQRKYKMEKSEKYIKAVGILSSLAIAGVGGTTLAMYAQKQQYIQNQKAIEFMKQNPARPLSELRQMYEFDEWMQEQEEEYERTRGM